MNKVSTRKGSAARIALFGGLSLALCAGVSPGSALASGEHIEDEYLSMVREYHLEAFDWGYRLDEEPIQEITVYEGDLVRLVLSAEHDHDHAGHGGHVEMPAHGLGIRIGGEYYSADVASGETETIEFIASEEGTFQFFCTVFCGFSPDYKQGHHTMKGTLRVLDPEENPHTLATPSNAVLEDYVTDADHYIDEADWHDLAPVRVEMDEMSFGPGNLEFEVGHPYKLEMANEGSVPHEFTSEAFYRSLAIWKAEGKSGEYKAPFFTEIVVFPGEQVNLYFVPTQEGTFEVKCELPGHYEAGMHGHILVTGTEGSDHEGEHDDDHDSGHDAHDDSVHEH